MATITRAETSDHTYDSSVEQTSGATSPHSVIRRLAERFALIAFGLYHIPLFLNNYPSLGGGGFNDTGLAPLWGRSAIAVGSLIATGSPSQITGAAGRFASADCGAAVSTSFASRLFRVMSAGALPSKTIGSG